MSEDCLYLNLYSPYEPSNPHALYPVMVYIHGGSYLFGSANDYDGSVLPQFGVVVVTINYRLGILGLMTSGDQKMSGNYGIKDQTMTLQWVSEHIRAFRGDPSKVTIFGNSAGGGSVGLLLASPRAKDLFHRAIIQSGPVIAFWGTHSMKTDLKAYFKEVSGAAGCSSANIEAAIICLKNLPWAKLVAPSKPYPLSGILLDFKPWADGVFLPRYVNELIQRGEVNKVPTMIGTTSAEWTKNMGWSFNSGYPSIFSTFDKEGLKRSEFIQIMDYLSREKLSIPRPVMDALEFEYTDWKQPSDPIVNRDEYIQFFSDLAMVSPSVQMAEHLTQVSVPVYFYSFDHALPPDTEFGNGMTRATNKSYHQIELHFVFGGPHSSKTVKSDKVRVNFSDKDREVSTKTMKLWTNFAKYGAPTPTGVDSYNMNWQEFTMESSGYLHLASDDFNMQNHFSARRMALWNNLVPMMKTSLEESNDSPKNASVSALWIFLGLCLVLTMIVIILGIIICKLKQYNRYDWNHTNTVAT
ncbi:neuroligin-4, Y-linked-like [Lineus longissimus]|uniref:neuroligin-4, Y-linked-like n=1 Tax=Lineus longissimus TaxID=88925 RepID=UPI002B4E83C4